MIFYIGNEFSLSGLTQVQPRLFLDEGWSNKGTTWYKGYSTECVLSERIDDIINGYRPSGKWCVIHDETVYYPVLRGFPLYHKNNDQTNLKLEGFEPSIYLLSDYPENNERLSIEEVSVLVGDILVENAQNFYKYNNPENMTVYLSGGLDTLTCWTIQEQVSKDFNLCMHLPVPTDTTIHLYCGTKREYHNDVIEILQTTHWGYYHPSYLKELNWTNSGFYAETYTYRDISALSAFAKYLGKSSITELTNENDYYYHYLKRPFFSELAENFVKDHELKDEDELRRYLWSTVWYDHQMWHLDKNMFFCPFADIRIPEIVLKLSMEDIIRISVHGDIQRHIIQRFKPEALPLLSDYKNEKDVWANFKANFNESMLHPDTRLIYT